jgi:hypothetical protein
MLPLSKTKLIYYWSEQVNTTPFLPQMRVCLRQSVPMSQLNWRCICTLVFQRTETGNNCRHFLLQISLQRLFYTKHLMHFALSFGRVCLRLYLSRVSVNWFPHQCFVNPTRSQLIQFCPTHATALQTISTQSFVRLAVKLVVTRA